MSSVCVRFEEMTASHRFELQSETKDDHQQSMKLRKCLSRRRCRKPKRVIFQVTEPDKASSTKKINNCGRKQTAYLPPSCSLLRESGAAKSTRNCW